MGSFIQKARHGIPLGKRVFVLALCIFFLARMIVSLLGNGGVGKNFDITIFGWYICGAQSTPNTLIVEYSWGGLLVLALFLTIQATWRLFALLRKKRKE